MRSTVRVVLAAAVGLPLFLGAAGLGLLHTAWGTAWVLASVPGLTVVDPKGAVLGEAFSAQRVAFAGGATRPSWQIDELQWSGAHWRWWVREGIWLSVQAQALQATRVSITPPATPSPAAAPRTLRWPIEAQLASVRVQTLQWGSAAPVTGLSARVHLGAMDGAAHRVQDLSFQWDRASARAEGRIATDPPFAVQAQAQARSLQEGLWQAEGRVEGELAALRVQAALTGRVGQANASPSLDASVVLRPFERWPLGTLRLEMEALDLAALASGAPRTRLSGKARVDTRGLDEPASAELSLDNRLAGRWDEGRLPLRRVRLDLRGNPSQRDRLELPGVELEFGDAAGPAGSWRGQGRWDGQVLELDTRLIALRPQKLDRRAAAVTVSGPLKLVLKGVVPPGPERKPDTTPLSLGFQGALEGAFDGLGRPLVLALEGSASAGEIELRRALAESGDARAEFSATLRRGADGRWAGRSQGRVSEFDPVPWVPGEASSPWRRGPNRLNASWNLEGSAVIPPAGAEGKALATGPRGSARSAGAAAKDSTPAVPEGASGRWVAALQSLQGRGQLQIDDSRLAGTPLKGTLRIGQDPGAPREERSRLSGEVLLASNRLSLQATGDPTGTGESDRWRLELSAPAVAELAPLTALWPGLAEWTPRAGSMEGTLSVDGRWPDIRTEGRAAVRQLRAGELRLAEGKASWRVDGIGSQPVDLRLDLSDAAWGPTRVAFLRGDVVGTLRSHKARLDIAAPLGPAAWLEQLLGLPEGRGTQAALAAEGRWERAAEGGGRWRGQFAQLAAGVWNGSAAAAADASWLDVRQVEAEAEVDPQGRIVSARAGAGRAALAAGLRMRWDEVRYANAAGRHDLQLRAEVEPFRLAPLLQRLPTGLRLGGDLRVAAKLDVKADERFEAEVAMRRLDGDLTVTDAGGTQTLGLSELGLSLSAREGQWRLSPRFSGRSLGQVSGELIARTAPQARWPDAGSTLDGAVQVQVPNLSVWAGWIPPGWRIEGELSTAARLGGRLGAPEVTGDLRASRVGVRNLLQGVAVRDGELHLALRGDNARIERLTLRAGEGTLSADGSATLGARPSAQLRVQAREFRVLGRVDRQLVASGQAALTLERERLRLEGRIGVDSGLFDLSRRDAPALDEDVSVVRDEASAATRPEPAAAPPLLRNATVALDIDLGQKLRLRGRGLDTALGGTLRLSTPGGRMAVNGSVRAEGGTYAAYGQKLEIDRGVIAFAGPLDTARLDILALRPNLDMRVGVAITGSAQFPRVRLVSEPEMSETDKLSWLVLGRGSEGLARTDTAVLQRAAVALLAGEGEGPTDSLMKAIGLDDLSIRQTEGEVRDTIVSLGKQLSRRWYVGYERGVNATSGTWQLVYRVAQRFTLRAQSGLESSLDLIWTWRFGQP